MTKVAISQPTYLPWLGYFEQISRADIFVFLDNVQFERRSWQSRNRIKSSDNQDFWLTVPVKKHHQLDVLNSIKIQHDDPNKWHLKHLKSIELNLAKTRYINNVLDLLEPIYASEYEYLSDLNISIIMALSQRIGLKTKFIRASDLGICGIKAELLLDICKSLDASVYLANVGSKVYLDESLNDFNDHGIDVVYQDWIQPVYKQKFGEFIPNLAWVDPVSYLGFDQQSLFRHP